MNPKIYRIAGVLFVCSVSCFAQGPALPASTTPGKNYTVTNTPQVKGITESTQIEGKSVDDVGQVVLYYDDLGRPVQTINTMASPAYNDVVLPQVYDAYGREVRKYLPFTEGGATGEFKTDALSDATNSYNGSAQYMFYQSTDKVAHDQTPYSDAVLENSPLGRVLKQGAPGTAWKASSAGTEDHAVEHVYLTNGYHTVLRFDYSPVTGILLNNLAYYDEYRLVVTKTIDEHNFETLEYADKQSGHVVCKKVQYGTDASSNKLFTETYYIYDDLGNLVIVLPPEAVIEIKSILSN